MDNRLYTERMVEMNILLSFVGNRDPYPRDDEEPGPLLSLLQERQYQQVYLFCTGADYLERARMVEEAGKGFQQGCRFNYLTLELDSPIDYVEIFSKLSKSVDQVTAKLARQQCVYSVLLDPGTPQMQTVWFLLAKSHLLEAVLLQGIPPRFAGGAYKVREVELESEILPEVHAQQAENGRAPAEMLFHGEPGLEERTEHGEPGLVLAGLEHEAAVLESRKSGPETKAPGQPYTLRNGDVIIGEAPAFLKVMEQAQRVAAYDISILIRGQTGTGKDLLARFVHEHSTRRDQPLVAVNCASVGAALAESELFGHVKGAFTGAERNRPGKFRSADGGTILLDEIGDLPVEIQAKLLRILENRTLVPVGADQEIQVDVRILAATNQDLDKLIEEGRFRRDLYERLNQYSLVMPPLRERRTDIPLLIKAFLGQWNGRYREEKQISEEAMQYLLEYPWKGNIRELRNSVTSMCATALSGRVGLELLPVAVLRHFKQERSIPEVPLAFPDEGINLKALLYQTEKELYQQALAKAGGNREQAARLLGLNGPAFRKALRERFDIEGDGGDEAGKL